MSAGRPSWSLVLLVLTAVLAAAGCKQQVPSKQEAPRPVRWMLVAASSVEATLALPGEVKPRVETRYGFRVGGKISRRLVSVGDRVAAGTLLARLDPQDVEPAIAAQSAQVQAAATELALARAELGRQAELRAQNYISAAQLDRQQAATDAAAARLKAAQAQLDAARNSARFQALYADSDGVVTAAEAEAGQVVAAGQPVIRVAGTGEKEVLVNLPEAQIGFARSVRHWSVEIPALGERILEASLRELSPLADPASRTYPMRLSLQGRTQGVELGMSAVVRARSEKEAAFVLPISVLWSRDDKTYVWIVDEKGPRVRAREVRTEGLFDDRVRVVEGLKGGERVVTAGASLLSENQTVRLLEATQ
jgi:multidrug efflux system membrane fusion protein